LVWWAQITGEEKYMLGAAGVLQGYVTGGVDLLSKERIVAGPAFNRWLAPPAALAIHLCIGMAYGFSVFWLPLTHALNGKDAVACPPDMTLFGRLFTTACDWKISELGMVYALFFVFLGAASAIWGGWLERTGPRKAGFVSACCWCGGLILSALGIYCHQLWLVLLGAGAIGGIGLGLGYIAPVSTLIKWFPERRGMATGMAVAGFGGGAMIGAPLADILMRHYATPASVGVWETLLTLAIVYFALMTAGAFTIKVPASGWKPKGWTPPAPAAGSMISTRHVHVDKAVKTPQFWLVWSVLCLNVTAGIGIIGMASPMLQEVFGGRLIGVDAPFSELSPAQLAAVAAIAAGFTGLISLFNIIGRFAWASSSDLLGRKLTYCLFFGLGIVLYASAPWSSHVGSVALFVAGFCVILSMYGGGFATMPAYLADLFGTQMVGAIMGRLLTAWSVAGVLGPLIVGFLRDYQLARNVPPAQVYDVVAYVLCALLSLGLLCNLMVRPVAGKHFMTEAEVDAQRKLVNEAARLAGLSETQKMRLDRTPIRLLVGAWMAVGLPVLWAICITLQKAWVLFS
jgi:MFS family permease